MSNQIYASQESLFGDLAPVIPPPNYEAVQFLSRLKSVAGTEFSGTFTFILQKFEDMVTISWEEMDFSITVQSVGFVMETVLPAEFINNGIYIPIVTSQVGAALNNLIGIAIMASGKLEFYREKTTLVNWAVGAINIKKGAISFSTRNN